MKIKDLLEQEWKQDSPEFKSKETGIDPETGSVSWDIEYTPLRGVDKSIEKAYNEYKDAIKKYPNDQKLDKLFELFTAFKKEFRKHVTRKYGR
jgi:hypothetical protein